MEYNDIKKFPESNYSIDVPIKEVPLTLKKWNSEESPLILSPEFQRGYVWNTEQQIAYCEYLFRGGRSGKDIFFNCSSWMGKFDTPIECVDGQQRLGSIIALLEDRIKIFGVKYSDIKSIPVFTGPSLKFHVCNIQDRKELIEWYIAMNTAGSVHTAKDLIPAYEELKKLSING